MTPTTADAAPDQADEPGRGRRTLLAALAFWTVLGLLESTTAYVRLVGTPRQRTYAQMLVGNMPWWLIWALLTPLVFLLARRVPLHGTRWRRGVAVHVLAAFALASVHLVLEGITYYYTVTRGHVAPSLGWQLRMFFGNYLVLDFVTYWVIVGGCYAFDFHARYRASALRSARLELGLAQARMQALRAELNPHFFFNALNAVSGLVRLRENEAAVRMLARLGDLLRATLDRDLATEIPLPEELELLDRYLDIERVRFGDRLTIDVEVEPGLDGALVPPLLLQPLVENAIRHGITARPGQAHIRIGARREGDALRLSVRDSGEGFEPRAITVRREGIGLSNVRARLAELHGARARLLLENAPGGGASVTVVLPLRDAAVPHAVGA